ncbi:MAG: hypothetical protein WD673_09855 [Alphaproteobacteria bacterium]
MAANTAQARSEARPTEAQARWLRRGVGQAGGKLPLFDGVGQQVDPRTIQACLRSGWAEPWIANPIKPDWLVCRLTDLGREAIGAVPDD